MPTQPLHAANRTPSLGGATPLLACTRFNNKTWQEDQQWKSTHQQSYEQTYKRPLKCIYGTPREISHKKFPPQAKILVIEMNNDENRIMGIGEIQNQTASEVYRSPSGVVSNPSHNRTKFPPLGGGPPFRKLFSDRNYSRYIYIGNTYYASREELERNHTADAQYINKILINNLPDPAATTETEMDQTPQETRIQSLERLLFKGARHMKRGSGITGVAPPNGAAGVAPPNGAATLFPNDIIRKN